jgi:hypothetical protein
MLSVPVLLMAMLLQSADPIAKPQAKPDEFDPTGVNLGLGGIIPANVPYQPLTGKQRWSMFVNSTAANPSLYARIVILTVPEHLNNTPEQWGQGWGALGKRLGSRTARLTISTAIEQGGNAMMGHDPRYVSCRQCTSTAGRIKHSFYYTFLTYNRQGKPVFNYGNIAGQVGSEVIAASWIPGRTWRSELGIGMAEQVGFNWLANIAREFAPEIKRLLPRKK